MTTSVTKKYRVTIAAPIYPPEIGGPAQYAEMLASSFHIQGGEVHVVTYGMLKKLPTGLRHIFYFFRLLPAVLHTEYIVVLDTFSAGLPAVLVAMITRRKVVVRVGGDFLWEAYVERTKEQVLLSEFYIQPREYTRKEKIIFSITKFVFDHADKVVFSTPWQRDIMADPYTIDMSKTAIVENVYVERRKRSVTPKQHIILSPSRNIFLKNIVSLKKAFLVIGERVTDVSLDTEISNHARLLDRIQETYCLVVPSFSEVSPNIVLDALSMGVPAVVTSDCGIRDRVGDCVIWIDPRDVQSIVSGIETLLDAQTYAEYSRRISLFSFTHTPQEIVREYIEIFNTLS